MEIAEEEWHAVEGLQALGWAKGVPALLRRLPNLPPVVAGHAVRRILPVLGGERAYRALAEILREHPDPALREAAAAGGLGISGRLTQPATRQVESPPGADTARCLGTPGLTTQVGAP